MFPELCGSEKGKPIPRPRHRFGQVPFLEGLGTPVGKPLGACQSEEAESLRYRFY